MKEYSDTSAWKPHDLFKIFRKNYLIENRSFYLFCDSIYIARLLLSDWYSNFSFVTRWKKLVKYVLIINVLIQMYYYQYPQKDQLENKVKQL